MFIFQIRNRLSPYSRSRKLKNWQSTRSDAVEYANVFLDQRKMSYQNPMYPFIP